MGLFSRKYPDFNAIIEGNTQDDPQRSHLKLITLSQEVHADMGRILDDKNKYSFYCGNSSPPNFKVLRGEGLECRIDSLSFYPGLILNSRGYFLERPRALILQDGRVFVEDSLHRTDYVLGLVARVSDLRSSFDSPVFKKDYQRYQAQLHSRE